MQSMHTLFSTLIMIKYLSSSQPDILINLLLQLKTPAVIPNLDSVILVLESVSLYTYS